MKARIRYGGRVADVSTSDSIDAGWMGFRFAKNNRDLVEAGWSLHYYGASNSTFDHPDTLVLARGVAELAERIREGLSCSHSCPHHKPVEYGG